VDTPKLKYAEFYASKSKPLIDEIDSVLAEYFNFSAEECNFIVNYDVKFRMGVDV
jgi:hypothetical protein